MKTELTSTTRHNHSADDMKLDKSRPQGKQNMKTNTTTDRTRHFDESETTSIETTIYSENSISMSEYRILNPQTAEVPTLTQSRVLAAVLERVRIKEARRAKSAARRKALMEAAMNAVIHPWEQFMSVFHHAPQPALARVHVASGSQAGKSVRVTSSYLALPRA